MNASYKPSIASEVHARHKRPHRLALLATSPVATGEAKIGKTPQGDGAYLQPPPPERGSGQRQPITLR